RNVAGGVQIYPDAYFAEGGLNRTQQLLGQLAYAAGQIWGEDRHGLRRMGDALTDETERVDQRAVADRAARASPRGPLEHGPRRRLSIADDPFMWIACQSDAERTAVAGERRNQRTAYHPLCGLQNAVGCRHPQGKKEQRPLLNMRLHLGEPGLRPDPASQDVEQCMCRCGGPAMQIVAVLDSLNGYRKQGNAVAQRPAEDPGEIALSPAEPLDNLGVAGTETQLRAGAASEGTERPTRGVAGIRDDLQWHRWGDDRRERRRHTH